MALIMTIIIVLVIGLMMLSGLFRVFTGRNTYNAINKFINNDQTEVPQSINYYRAVKDYDLLF
jgi:hypothetical protein